MARMHTDDLEIDEALVRRLLAEQLPAWAELPLSRVEPAGTVNAILPPWRRSVGWLELVKSDREEPDA